MILEHNGIVDYRDNGRYFNPGTGEWADLSSWDTWTSWTLDPHETLYLNILTPLDLGSVQTVNILTDIVARGEVNYYIYYSNENTFTESPLNYSTVHITPGETNIPSITGRYFYIKVALDLVDGQGFQYFDTIAFRASEASTQGQSLTFNNIDSSTLSGTTSDRVFDPGIDVGTIKSAQITCRNASTYNVDMYVYHSTTSTHAFPKIISTGQDLHLTFIGVDGRPRDCTFDIALQVNPEWYMDAQGNLTER
jgi:hypothetical protein